MLINIQKNGGINLNVDEMPNSLLKRIYQSEGIKYSEVYFLANTEKELYSCSINAITTSEDFLSPQQRIGIELGINDLRKIFVKHMAD